VVDQQGAGSGIGTLAVIACTEKGCERKKEKRRRKITISCLQCHRRTAISIAIESNIVAPAWLSTWSMFPSRICQSGRVKLC
jgi:hypothetical protein